MMKGFREATEVRKQEGGGPFPLIHWYGSKYLCLKEHTDHNPLPM